MTTNRKLLYNIMTRFVRHFFAIVLSLFVCSLLSLLIIPLKGLLEFYAGLIVIQFLLISLVISLIFDLLNDVMKANRVLKILRYFVLPIVIASIGGIIPYYLWVDEKLSLDEDIYLMIVVFGALNGLIISLTHFLILIAGSSKYLKVNMS